MNRNLRVFLLASLMVLVAAASGWSTEISTENRYAEAFYDNSNNNLIINRNGSYTFSTVPDKIDKITLKQNVSSATVELPATSTNMPSNVISGKYSLEFLGATDMSQTLTITGETTNAGIILSSTNTAQAQIVETINNSLKTFVDHKVHLVEQINQINSIPASYNSTKGKLEDIINAKWDSNLTLGNGLTSRDIISNDLASALEVVNNTTNVLTSINICFNDISTDISSMETLLLQDRQGGVVTTNLRGVLSTLKTNLSRRSRDITRELESAQSALTITSSDGSITVAQALTNAKNAISDDFSLNNIQLKTALNNAQSALTITSSDGSITVAKALTNASKALVDSEETLETIVTRLNEYENTLRNAVSTFASAYPENTRGEETIWNIPQNKSFVVDVPLRINTKQNYFNIRAYVRGKLTFGTNANVYTNPSNLLSANGYENLSTAFITIFATGDLIIRNTTAVRGSGLTINNNGTLTFDIPSNPTVDIKQATITNNGTVNVPSSLTLQNTNTAGTWLPILASGSSPKFTKNGLGTLTLKRNGLSDRVTEIVVGQDEKGGRLVFNGDNNTVWSGYNLSLRIRDQADFEAYTGSISTTDYLDIYLEKRANATFGTHAIKGSDSEIYPYEPYITKNNGMKIDINNVTLNVDSTDSKVTINGIQAFNTVKGKGTIEVNSPSNGETLDDGVLILLHPNEETEYIDSFEGTINGNHASIGLFAPYKGNNNDDYVTFYVTFSDKIFRSADVTLENLIVYGQAKLNVNNETRIDKVENIWLRSHRPGADNTNRAISNIKQLMVGGLTIKRNSEIDDANVVELNNLRIDGTANLDACAVVSADESVDVYLSNIELYANKGYGRDFHEQSGGAYIYKDDGVETSGIYAVRFSAAHQNAPSRITLDGITGDGLAADVTNKVYQIEIADNTDVRINGDGTHYPIARNNNLLVGENGKLELAKGAIIDGHLKFEGSTIPYGNTTSTQKPTLQFNDIKLDSYVDFVNKLKYSVFTTLVGKTNRWTNEDGEYAVTVTGDIENSGGSKNRVYLRTKVELDAFDGYETTTIGERFKVLGSNNNVDNDDFATVKDDRYDFEVTAAREDNKGVTVEVGNELAFVKLGGWSFLENGEAFGQGSGHNFAIKVPFTVLFKGQEVKLVKEKLTGSTLSSGILAGGTALRAQDIGKDVYYVELDGARHYFFPITLFNVYEKGVRKPADSNSVIGNAMAAESFSNSEIRVRAEFEFEGDEQYIRLNGTSYTGDNPVEIDLGLALADSTDDFNPDLRNSAGNYLNNISSWYYRYINATSLTWMNDIVEGYDTYQFIREGVTPPDAGLQWSRSPAEAVGDTDFTVDTEATVQFKVGSIRKATYENGSLPELVNGVYIWNDGTVTTDYFMVDAQGREAKVSAIDLVVFDGNYLSRNTTSRDIATLTEESFDVNDEEKTITVSVPLSVLGNTGATFDAIKGLSIKGVRADGNGELITQPVNFTLHASVTEENTIAATDLNNEVTIGEPSVSGVYDIDPTIFGEGVKEEDIKLIQYDLPDWLGFYGNGSTLSYETKDLTGVEPGTYNFSVLAYSGQNALTSPHRLYTFSVVVNAALYAHIVVNPGTTINATIPEVANVSIAVVDDKTSTDRTVAVTPTGSAPELTLVSATDTITGNGTVEYRLETAELPEATYSYRVTVGDLTPVTFSIVVAKPAFEIVEVENGFDDAYDGRTYRAVYEVNGAEGEVTWSITSRDLASELYTAVSGDQFIVEGVARYSHDDTEDEDIEQVFVVSVSDGVHDPIEPEEGDTGYVAFTVEAEDEDIEDILNASIDDLAITGSSEAVAEGYEVRFPDGIEVSEVYLPSWLRPFPNEDEITGIRFAGPVGNLQNGAKATVFVEASDEEGDDVYYSWEVTYAGEPASLLVTADPATITVTAGETSSATLTVEGAEGTPTYASDLDWVSASGTTVTAAPGADVAAGTYTATITATDDAAKTYTFTIEVTVNESVPAPFTIAASAVTITLPATGTLTVTPSNANGTVSYTATSSAAALTVGAFTGNTATLTATASGDYTVTVNATDASGRTAEAITVNVRVNPATPAPVSLSVRANPTALTVKVGETATSTLTANIAEGTRYSSSAAWVTISGDRAIAAPTDAALVGQQTVTITATNGTQTATATLTITVEAAEPTPQPVVITPSATPISDENTDSVQVTADRDVPETGWVVRVNGNVVEWATIESTGARTATVTLDVPSSLAAGTYEVRVSATAADGTTNTVSVGSFTVEPIGGTVGSSGGGCDAGFGALALALAAPLFLRKRRS